MFWAASSLASARLNPTTPCLDAVYGVCSGVPFSPAAELMLTRLPPRSTRCGSAAAQVFHVPMRLTSTTVRHCSDVVVSQVPTVSTPALATAASRPPSSATPSSTAARQRRSVADVDDVRDRAPAVLLHQAGRLLEIFGRGQRVLDFGQRLADVDQDEVGAFFGESDGVAATHAPRRAGDQNALAGDAPVAGVSRLIACCRSRHRRGRSPR